MKLKDLKSAIKEVEDSFGDALEKEIYIDFTFSAPELRAVLTENCVTTVCLLPEWKDLK